MHSSVIRLVFDKINVIRAVTMFIIKVISRDIDHIYWSWNNFDRRKPRYKYIRIIYCDTRLTTAFIFPQYLL